MATALYHIVSSIHGANRPELLITPDEALEPPSKDELFSRWTGLSPDQQESILADFDVERDRLGDLELMDEYERILELVEADGKGDRDDSMAMDM
jgi:nuclear pore complex protein Nup133